MKAGEKKALVLLKIFLVALSRLIPTPYYYQSVLWHCNDSTTAEIRQMLLLFGVLQNLMSDGRKSTEAQNANQEAINEYASQRS